MTTTASSPAWLPLTRLADALAEVLLLSLLLFMPLALGAVEAWSKLIAIILGAAIALCLAVRLTLGAAQAEWSWAVVPIAGFVLLAAMQLATFPASFVALVSPNTVATRTALLSDLPDAPNLAQQMPLSFNPEATRHDLRIVLLAATVFLAVVTLYRRPAQIRRLLIGVTLIGGIVGAVALVQQILHAPAIYWRIHTGLPALSGPFVNHSHYAQFMNLSIGAALGALLSAIASRRHEAGLAWLRAAWWTIPLVVLGLVTISLSLTRGGMVAILVAGAVTLLVLATRSRMTGTRTVLLGVGLLAFATILYVGFDRVYDRFATLGQRESYGMRVQMAKDALRVWRQYPLVGVGLGAHEVVFPAFERSITPNVATHVENEYAQLAEETGVLGTVFLIAFLAIVWWNYGRTLRAISPPICAAAIGLGYGLIAAMVHSLSDFGQHVPAVAAMSAVTCGLIVNLGALAGASATAAHHVAGVLRWTMSIALVGAMTWSLVGAAKHAQAEPHWNRAQGYAVLLEQQRWVGDDDDYAELVDASARAVAALPTSARYRYDWTLNRWRAISRQEDPQTGWMILRPEARIEVAHIVQELRQVRRQAPTFGPAVYLEAHLRYWVLDQSEAEDLIQLAYRLSPNDALACWGAGRLDAYAGRWTSATEKFRRALVLRPGMLRQIVALYVEEIEIPELAIELLADNPDHLLYLSRVLRAERQQELSVVARDRVVRLLERRVQSQTASARHLATLASLFVEQGELSRAIEHYTRALEMDYGQVGWRYQRADALLRLERFDEARADLRLCLRLDPNYEPARRLLARIEQISQSRQ